MESLRRLTGAAWTVGGIVLRPFSYIAHRAGLENGGAAAATEAAARRAAAGLSRDELAAALAQQQAMPGPFTFFRSSIFLSLIFLSLLSNRITHLVPPRAAPLRDRRPLSPLLLASLRIPSLLLLLRAILLLAVILLTQRGFAPLDWPGVARTARWIGGATIWAGRSELSRALGLGAKVTREVSAEQVMWEVFVATAAASVTETFVRALNDDLPSQAPFNLLSFSFLLHINSLPIHSSSAGQAQASASATYLFPHLLLTLLELFHLHLSFALTPPMPVLRLPISAMWSGIGQIFVLKGVRRLLYATQWAGGEGSAEQAAEVYAYTSAVWLNRAPEMMFEVVVGVTVGLKLLVAVLRGEEISQATILGHPSHWPRMGDDYAVAVIRYGTSLLASTRLAGLANEVSPLRLLAPRPLALIGLSLPPPASERPGENYVVLGAGGRDEGEVLWSGKGEEMPGLGGLAREVRKVKAVERDGVDEHGEVVQRRPPLRILELFKFVSLFARIVFYVSWRIYRVAARWGWWVARTAGWGGDAETIRERWVVARPTFEQEDEEDGDWRPSDDESSDGSGSDSDDEEDDFDASTLYRDLTTAEDQEAPESALLLAHHLSPSTSSPLTRRRYRALTQSSPSSAVFSSTGFSTAVEERRAEIRRAAEERGWTEGWQARRREELDEGRQRFCVVCTVEERDIICWPCRCLALCNDCRGNLAERTPASEHLCPTCRAPVKGFSRIFVP